MQKDYFATIVLPAIGALIIGLSVIGVTHAQAPPASIPYPAFVYPVYPAMPAAPVPTVVGDYILNLHVAPVGTGVSQQLSWLATGLTVTPIATIPACTINSEAVLWFGVGDPTLNNPPNKKDTLKVCAKDQLGNFGWRNLY